MAHEGETEMINKYTFYSGLLLALCTRRRSFRAEGRQFYEAFMETVEFANREPELIAIEGSEHIFLDPTFGVVREANEMILEAEHDDIISLLNPRLKNAHFKITREEATQELNQLAEAEWYLELAEKFDSCLEAQA